MSMQRLHFASNLSGTEIPPQPPFDTVLPVPRLDAQKLPELGFSRRNDAADAVTDSP